MIITEIKKNNKGKRYSLFVDGNFVGSFEDEILVKYKLKTNEEISKDVLDKMKIENGNIACFDRGLSALEKSMKTEKMVREYLAQKGYPDESIELAIEKLKEYNYINDENFADAYIKNYCAIKGRKKIKYELINKGVDRAIIDEKLIEIIDEDDERASCKQLALKYLHNKVIDEKIYNKLIAHLAGKGFGFDIATQVTKEVLREVENESRN